MYLIIFSYCANICLRKVVDSKIVCLFTLVFKACNVCNFSKKIGLHLACFINTISYFMIYQKTNVRFFLFIGLSKTKMYSLLLVSIYSASQYLSDQPPFVENTVFPSVTFYSCDCELLADNYTQYIKKRNTYIFADN